MAEVAKTKRTNENDEPLISSTGTDIDESASKKRKISGDVSVEADAKEIVDEVPLEGGVLLICGGTNWDLTGRSQLPKSAKAPPTGTLVQNLWGPHVWKEKTRIRSVASSCCACHSAIITEDGKVMTWGRNECGQLGLGDLETRYEPTVVTALAGLNIVLVATGKNHTLFLTDKGTVYSCGDNKMGQLGQGTKGKNELTPSVIDYKGKPIVKMSCGGEFSMIVDIAGSLYSFGCPEYGQLGHNTDGKLLEKAGKLSYSCENSPRRITTFIEKAKGGAGTPIKDVVIVDVKCGLNHTVAFDTKGRVFTWGFAGYGRLGHSETKDEMIPRQLKQLENLRFSCKKIAAGSTFCLAADSNRMLYFWGQNKSGGDATMYPKPVNDLCGWNVRGISCCNKSVAVVADESLITWGGSPTFGELGYGDSRPKSSTTPQEVKPLEGIHVKEVAAGFGHLLIMARDASEEERTKISKLPTWPLSK